MATIKQKHAKIIKSIKQFFRQNGKKKAVLGLSGGIDSSLCAYLLSRAIGKKNLTGILMPELGITSKSNLADAKLIAKKIGIKSHVVPINNFIKQYKTCNWPQSKTAKGNLRARIRATILYNYANSNNAIVIGTGNKTELYLGYFTKYGDAAVDVLILADLWKREVRQIAGLVGVPYHIIWKIPTAELWKGQTDEGELGVTYDVADDILHLLVDKKMSPKTIASKGYPTKTINKIINTIKATAHKRQMPQILKI